MSLANKSLRYNNLDLFRVIAITVVVIFHVIQMFNIWPNGIPKYYIIGQYGVEFFFVLSGFLIAGLYYKIEAGKTNLFLFWIRRFLRTYPPYLITLFLSYGVVYFFRKEKFDPSYLIFFQNFKPVIPYFLVSWSLCIEEHFYIVFPFLVLLMDRIIKHNAVNFLLWSLLCICPMLLRYVLGNADSSDFGFYKTATFFRFEGIAIGCFFAFITHRLKIKLKTISLYVLVPLLLIVAISLDTYNNVFSYVIGYFVLTLITGLTLVKFYYSSSFKLAKFKGIKQVALMAYSLYLLHPLIIHAILFLTIKFAFNKFLGAFLCLILIYIGGYIFYKTIEQPAIIFRDKIAK